jgi:hypothetical protein
MEDEKYGARSMHGDMRCWSQEIAGIAYVIQWQVYRLVCEESWCGFRKGQGIYIFCKTPRLVLGSTQRTVHCLSGPLSLVYNGRIVKLAVLIYRCGRNEWSIPPAPPLVPSWHAQRQLQDCSRKTSNVMTGWRWWEIYSMDVMIILKCNSVRFCGVGSSGLG